MKNEQYHANYVSALEAEYVTRSEYSPYDELAVGDRLIEWTHSLISELQFGKNIVSAD